jgi:DNA topoisomerase-2
MKDPKFFKTMKLVTSVSLTNMHAFDPELRLRKYEGVEDILRQFYDIRLRMYEARKVFDLLEAV